VLAVFLIVDADPCDTLRLHGQIDLAPVPVIARGWRSMPAREFRMQFGTRCFFAWMPSPDGGVVWFANPPMAREPEHGVLATMGDAQWRRWLHDLMAGDAGPAHHIIEAAPGPLAGWATYDVPVVRRNAYATATTSHEPVHPPIVAPRPGRASRQTRCTVGQFESRRTRRPGHPRPDTAGRVQSRRKDGGKSMMWLQGHHIDFNEPISLTKAA